MGLCRKLSRVAHGLHSFVLSSAHGSSHTTDFVNSAMSQRAAILGLGNSGEAAARLLRARGWDVTVLNSSNSPSLHQRTASLAKEGISTLVGPAAENDPDSYDLCVISPGIAQKAPIVQNILRKDVPMIGEIELAFRECSIPVVAVTGTNGKTTTTELIETMLNGCGIRAHACGNIGLPFSELVRKPADLQIVVVEVSSFQLETIHTFHPHIALWLNLSPNHLDRYRSTQEYREAKLRIFLNQTSEDFAIVNARDHLPPLAAKRITFGTQEIKADFSQLDSKILYQGTPILDQKQTRLEGLHNVENLMATLAVGTCLGLEFPDMGKAVAQYVPPHHRCELVRTHDNIRWINDSKSTNLDSLEKAIRAQSTPIILIAGGKDKGFEFDSLAPLVLKRVKAAILIGEMRHRIAASWPSTSSKISETLEDAIRLAANVAVPGDTILFSPGTSSFDMFQNYEDRGDRFKHFVRAI